MGYWENLNTDNLNLKTDGEIKYVNGALQLVPWMEGVDDNLYQGCIDDLLKMDWVHYKLYLVGGLLQGWKTTDIDICITGEVDENLPVLMKAAMELGPFDMYYVKSLDDIKGTGNRIWEFAKPDCKSHEGAARWHGQWKADGMFWMTEKFDPKGRTYDKEPLALN
jgi:hypothetical protein